MSIQFTASDIASLSPYISLFCGALLLLLVETFWEKTSMFFSGPLSLIILAVGLICAIWSPESRNPALAPWLRFDTLERFFNILFLSIGIGTVLLSIAFFKRFAAPRGEYFFLLLSSIFGLLLIGSSADFLTLFLGIETLSISLYILCGYIKDWNLSHESAMKYFLMGALGTAFFLYGISMLYGATGTTHFAQLLPAYKIIAILSDKVLFLAGIAFVTVGLAFKSAIVPFHVWAPDVYDGAPTPVTAFMAVGTKAGAFAAFAILFLVYLPGFDPIWNQAVEVLSLITLIYANFVALRQTQLRRFFAYSGISHAGYLLLPLVAGSGDALSALNFYLVIYSLATLGAFGVVALLDRKSQGVTVKDLHGLYKRAPLSTAILVLCLLTLAGIPPTAGFFAKFYLFKVAFQAGYVSLVVIALLTAIIGAFYYLRLIVVMFSQDSMEEEVPGRIWTATLVGSFSALGILLLSFYPEPLINLIAAIKP